MGMYTYASSPTCPTSVAAASTGTHASAFLQKKESHSAVSTTLPSIQCKLSVGSADDELEQEADTMADTVMRKAQTPFVQRKCADCEKEEQVQAKPLTPFIQKKGEATTASDAVSSQIQSSRGNGSPLPAATQGFMESQFGADFSGVKIHADTQAADLSQQLNAQAFTVGNDIYFNQGKYNPESEAGQHLLAHELTHTLQQQNGIRPKRIQRRTKDEKCSVHAYDNSNPKDTAVIPSRSWWNRTFGKEDKSVMGVSSVPDLVTKVNAYINSPDNDCSCVSTLEINGHGTNGYQSVGNGNLYVNDEKALVHDSKQETIDALKSIKFCSKGILLLMGCHVGKGLGLTLLKRVSNALPNVLIGGAQHYTFGAGKGRKKVVGEGDETDKKGKVKDTSKAAAFMESPYVSWYITIGGKEYVIEGKDRTSTDAQSKLKMADSIKLKTPEGEIVKVK